MSDPHGNQMVTDEEILAAFDDIEGPFVTATELAEHLPISRKGVLNRLETLHKQEVIGRKQPVSYMVGWWRYEDDAERQATAEQLR